MERNNPLWIVQHKIWQWNLFWYRDLLYWNYHRKLRNVAEFIEKHKLYPVTLNENLINVWKSNSQRKTRNSLMQ